MRSLARSFSGKSAASAPHPLLDSFGRFHDYLRVSLTEKCNLRCTYCMPAKGVTLYPPTDLLSSEELLRVIRVFVKLGVSKIRLTRGEPLLRKDIVPLCKAISAMPGVTILVITTNGVLLSRLAKPLHEAGFTNLNISLDSLNKQRFEQITKRSGLNLVVSGLAHVVYDVPFEKIKLNCVVQRGVNEDELASFVHYTKTRPVQVRFLEHMPFEANNWTTNSTVSYLEMVDIVSKTFPGFYELPPGKHDVAKLWKVPGHQGEVGFITAMTDAFCGTCNRYVFYMMPFLLFNFAKPRLP
jgi:molybdenum cofactor biosynthesis protein A